MWSTCPPWIVSVSSRTSSRTTRVRIAIRASFVTSAALEYGAGRVEPVRADEMRVVQAELGGLGIHHHRERREARCDGQRERVGRVVRRLDERALQQVADRDLLARTEIDRLLADRGRTRVDGDDVGELLVLEHDQHRHQLRDRGDRQLLVRIRRGEHLAGRGVLDHVGMRVDRGRPRRLPDVQPRRRAPPRRRASASLLI